MLRFVYLLIFTLVGHSINAQIVTKEQLIKTAWVSIGVPTFSVGDSCTFYNVQAKENKNKYKVVRSEIIFNSSNSCKFYAHQVCTVLFNGKNRSWQLNNDEVQIINEDGTTAVRFRVLNYSQKEMRIVFLKR